MITIYKDKGDSLQCKNFRGIKLLEVGLKELEKVMDKRLRKVVTIEGTIDAMQGELFVASLDLEKAYDRVPRELVYWCIRKRGILEKLVRIVTASYENLITSVRIPFDDTEEFEIKVGLHQGSALSPLLFILVLDTLTSQLVILELQHLGS